MRSVTVRLDDLKTMILNIGFVGENEHKRFIFDCKRMFDQYPNAAASMTIQPPEGEAYPAIIERDGDFVIWDVTDSDLIHDGDGELQLSFTQEPHLAKSVIGNIKVCRSIIPTGEIPEGIDDFLTRAGAALTAIPETIEAALEEAKESGEFDGPPGPQGERGEKGDTGSAGPAGPKGDTGSAGPAGPKGDKGDTGSAGPAGPKGDKGDTGSAGADGYSPTATVSKSGKVATITITDKNGTTTAQISDGEDGGGGGAVDDVQINGTSILSQGVANIPVASTSTAGAAKASLTGGTSALSDGAIIINATNWLQLKKGTNGYNPVVPSNTPSAVFYGLARAAGDTTQDSQTSDSVNSMPNYTENAKSKIHDMLDAPETISGTTPSITAKAGVRYICGEVSTLTIVVPSSGCIDVTFESGSTPTVLTVTPPTGMTMKWANGFDPTALEANTTYEINILDGCLGVAGSWT